MCTRRLSCKTFLSVPSEPANEVILTHATGVGKPLHPGSGFDRHLHRSCRFGLCIDCSAEFTERHPAAQFSHSSTRQWTSGFSNQSQYAVGDHGSQVPDPYPDSSRSQGPNAASRPSAALNSVFNPWSSTTRVPRLPGQQYTSRFPNRSQYAIGDHDSQVLAIQVLNSQEP